MGVLAYRVIEIKRAETASFKLGSQLDLLDFIEQHNEDYAGFYEQLNADGGGMVNVSVTALRKAVKSKKLKLPPEVVAALRKDIAWAEAQGVDDVQYDCF